MPTPSWLTSSIDAAHALVATTGASSGANTADTVSFGPLTLERSTWNLLSKGGSVVVTLAIAILLVRLIPLLERLVTRFANKHQSPRDATASVIDTQQRLATLTRVTSSIAQAVIWTMTLIVVLGDVGIAVAPLLATAGVATVAIGIGAQSIVKDFFSGFFILLENQFDVGDTITVNNVTGTVERMTMRITVLRDTTGTAHFFPNSNVVNVANRSYGWVRATLDLSFAPAVVPAEIRAALESVGRSVAESDEWKTVMVESGRAEGPVDLANGAVTWRLAAKVRPGFADDVRAALILGVAEELARRGWKMSGNVIG